MPSACIDLEVLEIATIPMPEGYVFRSAGPRLAQLWHGIRPNAPTHLSPCLAFVIRHPTAGTIVVDTGLHPDAARGVRRDFGLPMSLMFRGLRPPDASFPEQLRRVGVDAAEVDRVLMTHLHVDHTSGMRLLPRATFTCARAEWDAAHRPGAAAKGYVRRHLPPERRMNLIDPERDGVPHGPFERTIDLLGDGTIHAVSTPGHTAGHVSYLLQGPGERETLLVGDAAYTVRSIVEQRLPMVTDDDEASRRSLRELKQFVDDHPDAAIIPSHDPLVVRLSRGKLDDCST